MESERILMSKKKKDEKIIVSAIGTSKKMVTGSCWNINFMKDNGRKTNFLVELGLPQTSCDLYTAYKNMKRMAEEVKAGGLIEEVSYAIFLHS